MVVLPMPMGPVKHSQPAFLVYGIAHFGDGDFMLHARIRIARVGLDGKRGFAQAVKLFIHKAGSLFKTGK